MTTPTPAKPRTRAQINSDKRDALIRKALDQGWQLISETADQNETARLLRSAAKRCRLHIQISLWKNRKTVTYRVITPGPTASGKAK